MGGHNLAPHGWDSVNASENLGKAAALPALPLITPLPLECVKSCKEYTIAP